MTVCRPSAPPASWIITSTRSFITPSFFPAYTARAKTSGTAAYPAARPAAPAAKTKPFFTKSRRVSRVRSVAPISPSSFQLELGRHEHREPAGPVVARIVQLLHRAAAEDAVELTLVRLERGRNSAELAEDRRGVVRALEHRVRRDPRRVVAPARDARRIEEVHAERRAVAVDRAREIGRAERLRARDHELDGGLDERAERVARRELGAH